MNNPNENVSMALFCDFENVALGVRDTKFQKFDIRPVLERLLLKGSIVVKKAYCDWERYKEFKAPMHEANFELIEIPHVRQSGKNSADIRLVVDALDFCYTKSHVNTFVIISGDSDFSPLVSKLRENNKKVIGVGVKQSTSDLLIANCDEFIFYDDLAREGQRTAEARRDTRGASAQRRSPDEERRRKEEQDARKTRAVEMVVETFEALMAERGDSGKIWASALKDALKRRKPDFNESYYGFRAFGNLLEEAQSRGFLEVGREEKSGTYVYRDSTGDAPSIRGGQAHGAGPADVVTDHGEAPAAGGRNARKSRGGRKTEGGRAAGSQGEGADRDETGAAPEALAEGADAWKQPDAPQQTEGGTEVDVSEAPGQGAGAAPGEESPQARHAGQKDNARQGRSGRRGRGARGSDDARQTVQSGHAEAGSAVQGSPEARRASEVTESSGGQAAPESQAASEGQAAGQGQSAGEGQTPNRRPAADTAPPLMRPMPPLPQSALVSGPPPVVNVSEWMFVAPPAKAERERRGEASDPFAGARRGTAGSASEAASDAAPAKPATKSAAKSAAKPARGARKTAAKTEAAETQGTPERPNASAPAQSAQPASSSTPAADIGADTGTPAKPARKTARKTAPRKAAKKADSA
ncbi:NYN domain-containing protein [Achromobacter mucicolens]|uniref:NYN domain-containing protein n=1 Tax=Achromobacter mucicolens TaxID=1389922 RepID=UPI0024482A77|nr:NYN domain-containing protein [Achromobacter mucicolens]MDH0092091.1 NYN domain-containing protein [Achromobacter mucicolens]